MSDRRRIGGWVRLCALAFPAAFRARYHGDLEELLRDMRRSGRREGSVRTGLRLVVAGFGARIDDLRRRFGRSGPPHLDSFPNRSGFMETLAKDIAYALRTMRKNPGFTAIAALSLALGIGANSAIFSIVDALLLRSLPVQRPDELVVLHVVAPPDDWPDVSVSGWMLTDDQGRYEGSSFSYPFYERLREAGAPFGAITAFAPLYRIKVEVAGEAELESGQVVAGNYHGFFGLRPLHGRLLGPTDDAPSAPPAAVISYGYFQRRFGGDSSIVGRLQLTINGQPFTVVGVTPPGFSGALQVSAAPEITVPLAHQAAVMRQRELLPRGDYWWLRVMGRLGGEASVAQATTAAQQTMAASVRADLDGEQNVPTIRVLPGARGMTEERGLLVEPLTTIAWVVAAVLLIACANLANLLLARSGSRRREIAVRMSLGASRARLVRQLLTESVLLAGLGGVLGVLLALFGRGLFLGVLDLPEGFDLGVRLDLRVLAFTGGLALLTGLVFGIAPALRSSRFDLVPALKEEPGRAAVSRRERQGLSRTILVGQVAVSLALLVVAGLFIGSLRSLESKATGFEGADVINFQLDPRLSGYTDRALVDFYDELVRRSRRVPGVSAAAVAVHPPVSGTMTSSSFHIEGYEPAADERMRAFINIVDDAFFDTLRIQLVNGRGFTDADTAGSQLVAVVNERLVDRYLEGVDPIGRRLGFGSEGGAADYEIVGVVSDVKYQNLRDDPWAAVHVLHRQHADSVGAMTVNLKVSDGEPAAVMAAVRAVLRDQDASVPLYGVASQQSRQRANVAEERQFARLASALGAVALLLSCVGLYGILSYGVQRRTREIGIRVALGARGADVMRLVMREMVTVAVGVALGLGAAWALARSLESMLYEIEPMDPLVVGGAALVLLTIASFAAWLPARIAARVDPVEALRTS